MSGQLIGWIVVLIAFIFLAIKKKEKIKEMIADQLALYKQMKEIEKESYRSQALIEAHKRGVEKAKQKKSLGSNMRAILQQANKKIYGEQQKQKKQMLNIANDNPNLKKLMGLK